MAAQQGGLSAMTATTTEQKPALKATDEELLASVERVCETVDAPAAPTGLVAAELPIKRQTVKRRLDDLAESGDVAALATGQGHIWWLPEGEGGYVDPGALAQTTANIDPHDIPPDLAREIAEKRLPEFQPPETVWERLRAWGTGRADDVIAVIGLGLVLLVLPSTGLLADELATIGIGLGLIDALGVVALSVALLVAVLAGAARAAGALGMAARQRGLLVGDES